MERRKIKLWKITAVIFLLIYIILTIYSFLYDASYEPKYGWEFSGFSPLLVTNFLGLVIVFGAFDILGIEIDTSAVEAAFWIIMIAVNLVFYFCLGAAVGFVWDKVKEQKKKDEKGP